MAMTQPEVSRSHRRIVRTNSGHSIEDLLSANGTFVNGERTTLGSLHAAHDEIGVGDGKLIFPS
jgi:pSer/pThr/pTyr-binding forkhead associated (FHA) protein